MVVLCCLTSVGIICRIKITILSLENTQNLIVIVIELLSNVVDRFFRPSNGAASQAVSALLSNQPPKPYSALPSIWLRLGGDDIEPASPKAIPLSSFLSILSRPVAAIDRTP